MRVLVAVLAAAIPLVGCAASRPDRDVAGAGALLSYLEDGKTSGEEVLLKLGEPSGRFEKDRILTYRMAEDEKGNFIVAAPQGIGGWEKASYSLVLVFDDRRVLRIHKLVRVKS